MYVALEGIDTCGKSTQIAALREHFPQAIFTKEPGGSALGATLRDIILQSHNHASSHISKEAEFFLFLADRAEHIAKIIKPNLDRLIIADRSLISGIAYAKDLPESSSINLLSTQGIVPDLCFVFVIDEPTLQARLGTKTKDSIEMRGIDYLLAIQDRIIHTAHNTAKHTIEIDATKDIAQITQELCAHIHQALESSPAESSLDSSSTPESSAR